MKTMISLLLLCIAVAAKAQIQVGSNVLATMNRPGKLSSSDLDAFKKTTTVFTLMYKDYAQKQDFEKAIAAVWKITPFKIVKPDELKLYMKDGYSIFSFGGFVVNQRGSSTVTSTITLCYDLWLPNVKRNGEVKQDFFARIWMSPTAAMTAEAYSHRFWSSSKMSEKMLSYIYNDGGFYNWSAGYLKGYLKVVNDHLMKADERGPYSELVERERLSSLKSDTLYIPDYVKVAFNPFTGKESTNPLDIDEVKKEYPYPVRFVSNEQLDSLINSGKPVKYLVYVKNSSAKMIDIFDGLTGDLIYVNYVKMSYNFKNKDLGRLAKYID